MGLLALLGDQQINSFFTSVNTDSDLGVLPTVRFPQEVSNHSDWEFAAIFYNSNDTSERRSVSQVNVAIANMPFRKELVFVVYSLDNDNGSPYQLWQHMGSPVFPTDEQLRELRFHQVSGISSCIVQLH